MLLTSQELAHFIHVPQSEHAFVPLTFIRGLPVPVELVESGRRLGENVHTGRGVTVCLPDAQQNKCIYKAGSSRSGKSNALQHQVLLLAERGEGVGLLDPHRVTAQGLLGFFRPEDVERVVYLDFDDPECTVAYNGFADTSRDVGRLALELTNSFKHLFESGHFFRMNHLLAMTLYALFLTGQNLAAIPTLYSRSAAGQRLRDMAAQRAVNPEVKRHWQSEFYQYPAEAVTPILTRLSSLFMDDHAARIFSCEENKVAIPNIMDAGKLLLVALPSNVDVGRIVGGMLNGQMQKHALNRIGTPAAKNTFHIILDEFHRIAGPKLIESLINEVVKAGVHTTLANQETGQLSDETLKAVLSVPNIFVFRVNYLDAKKLAPVFNGQVSVDDILNLRVGDVFARIDHHVTSFRFPPPPDEYNEDVANAILRNSRDRYYIPRKQHIQETAKPLRRVLDTL